VTLFKQTMGADGGAFAQRTGLLRRLLWTRALPGGVAVIAALTFPELSIGAGEFADAKRQPDPFKPPSISGQGLIKQGTGAAKQPLAGVRYGALLDIAETRAQPAGQSRLAQLAPAAISPDEMASAPSRPAEPALVFVPTAVLSAVATSLPKTRRAPMADVSLGEGRLSPVRIMSKNELDAVVTYAASMLDSVVTPTALGARVSPAPVLETPISVDTLESAAAYTASVLDNVVPPPAVVHSPALKGAPATMPMLERGSVDDSAVERAATSFGSDLAGNVGYAGLTPMPAMPLRPPVSATTQPVELQPVSLQPPSAPPAKLAAVVTKPLPQAAALAPLPKSPAVAPPPGLGTNSPFALDIKSQLVTRVDGKAAGAVDFQQTATGLTVRLGSIVDILSDRYDPAQIARIRASAASNLYLSLDDLQAQGIPISYDPVYDEFNVGQTDTRPKFARKVHMDQIGTPERGLGTTAMDQVRR